MLDVVLRIAPFNIRLRSPYAGVREHVERFYAGNLGGNADNMFVDFDIQVLPGEGSRRWLRPQARFLLDGVEPFLPLPANQAAPLFEWGLNWSIASRSLGYLVLHAAVLAKDDQAIVLPGFPGAGKSTLCASLMLLDDWRLLSDELAILQPESARLLPNPRPISLKNASIDVVGQFAGARLGPSYRDTRKGTISHAEVTPRSRLAAEETARCRWIVFPRFEAGALPRREAISRAEAFMLISEQSFNKERMGEAGFHGLCRMLDGATCHEIDFGTTNDGVELIRAICGDPS
ncbi:MAG TPA: HprK-related kinase A [Thauera sp.]|uniref:HprK-related kinase A n=1 Tax=Thauera sp. TaxID=1905334 RepID=UPI002BBF71FD|nr:HprK-related kinase A [Thauera sp.]HRP24577.1 HprK-related kinase A [Thauera sp.]HRP67194.1 HprK-related kinase A [Thauera sp.]